MVSPQDKAKELVEKFKPLVTAWDCYHDTAMSDESVLKDAKECALICVEEISDGYMVWMDIGPQSSFQDYWEEVKKHIETL